MNRSMSDEAFFRNLAEQLQNRGRVALATVVETKGSGPSKDGRRFLVFEDGTFSGTIGGGPFEALVVADSAALFRADGPRRLLKWYDFFEREIGGDEREPTNMICGGSARVLVERLDAKPALLVYGGGHVGLALARIGPSLGFDVAVADDREEYSKPERFPAGVRTIRAGRDYALPSEAMPKGRDLYVAVVTRCWETDLAALRPWVSPGAPEAKYVGLIGSNRKIRGVFDRLREEGIREDEIRRVCAPIGLEIGAVTPEEIAVSILAEVTAVRRAAAVRSRVRESVLEP
ncbi:MAG TPA: XdhC/CoxI family protein [Thermoanaerobaculia bacterium]|nr:XdhC/CoxI family protein [Thermoanaerobaculia bacterium]